MITTITISATRNNEHEEKKDNFIKPERNYSLVLRNFTLTMLIKKLLKLNFIMMF
ncbi:hypothetical protein [Clostridium sp.]|uniref:hypothetical protein n=1 Tax=Clostridium sp. TaxID=1506 RepID=UPI003F7E3B3F